MKQLSTLIVIAFALFSCKQEKKVDRLQVMKADVEYLASEELEGRETGTKGERLAAEYIAERMQALGLTGKGEEGFFQTFDFTPKVNPHEEKIDTTANTITVTNVIGLIDNGVDKTVIIGAHYDHLGHGISGSLHAEKDSAIHNGADDNASGIALMLQLAENLKKEKAPKNNNYIFMAFSGEEMGLLGSNYYCKHPTVELASVNYMINFDMVGRLDTSKGFAVNGVGTFENWKGSLEAVNLENLNMIYGESGVGPSDHTSFYLQDIPVLHFFTGQHEDYHKPSDDAQKINYKGIRSLRKLVSGLVQELDSKEKLVFIKTKDDTGDTPRFTVTLGVMPDYLFQGEGMRIDGVTEDRPAFVAGFEKGDIVIQIDTLVVDGMQAYMKGLSLFEKGDSALVKVQRGEDVIEELVGF
ncbi:MAG: M28 family peptidase [Flavobacteriales bacterium]|nr:M28 family peptidase [Flavobacteriales bacterium]